MREADFARLADLIALILDDEASLDRSEEVTRLRSEFLELGFAFN
jgi:hypothetical protein